MVFIDIQFNPNDEEFYCPGQEVSGNIELKIKRSTTVQGVTVKIIGFAKTEWSHLKDKCRADETYFDSGEFFNGTPKINDKSFNLPAGTYNHRFSLILPKEIPSSYETKKGFIKYYVNVIINRKWLKNINYLKPIIVICPYNLNKVPQFGVPTQLETTEISTTYRCGGELIKPLQMTVTIPKRGLVPGEKILITTQFQNPENVKINEMIYILWKEETYTFYEPQPDSKTIYSYEVCESSLKTNATTAMGQISRDIISIPKNIQPNFFHCKIISIKYKLQVCCNLGRRFHKPYVEFPLEIGTIPIKYKRERLI